MPGEIEGGQPEPTRLGRLKNRANTIKKDHEGLVWIISIVSGFLVTMIAFLGWVTSINGWGWVIGLPHSSTPAISSAPTVEFRNSPPNSSPPKSELASVPVTATTPKPDPARTDGILSDSPAHPSLDADLNQQFQVLTSVQRPNSEPMRLAVSEIKPALIGNHVWNCSFIATVTVQASGSRIVNQQAFGGSGGSIEEACRDGVGQVVQELK